MTPEKEKTRLGFWGAMERIGISLIVLGIVGLIVHANLLLLKLVLFGSTYAKLFRINGEWGCL